VLERESKWLEEMVEGTKQRTIQRTTKREKDTTISGYGQEEEDTDIFILR
jgi:hypothetical protein